MNFFLGFISIMFIIGCTGTPVQQSASQTGNNTSVENAAGMTLDQALLEAADRIDERITRRTKIALLNFNSPSDQFSAYVLDELSANLVDSGLLTVIDRREIDLIRGELDFQMSGEVSDDSMQALGRMLGAQSIVTGSLRNIESGYRIMIRVLNVESATVEVQYRTDIVNDNRVASLMTGGRSGGTAVTLGTVNSGTSSGQMTTTAPAAAPAEQPIQGTLVPGGSLTEKLAWLNRSADSHNTYILEVNADESIAPYTFNFSDTINITVVLRGDDQNRTIRLRTNGTMFTVGSNITVILDNNITLHGHTGNSGPMIKIGIGLFGANGGTFIMRNGSTITGNPRGGVIMYSGTFEMRGGTISGNTASEGGGVNISHSAIGSGTFIMTGGTISGNTANRGGGVYMTTTTFRMRGGTITGNTAHEYGGGVFVSHDWANFIKSGGTITGYSSDPNNGNIVKDDADNVLARRGHAVYASYAGSSGLLRRKETSAGPAVNLSREANKSPTGTWDN